MKKLFYHRGFTLAEMLVAVTIFVLVIIAVYSSYALSQRGYLSGEEVAEITQNGRVILERMTREIRQAKRMVTGLAGGTTSSIEFEDGHTPIPSPYQELGSEHYYIRYYLETTTKEVKRQYRVYCFDDCNDACQYPFDGCDVCNSYHSYDATRETDPTTTHPCVLGDKIIGEYVAGLEFWGLPVINASTTLEKNNKRVHLKTQVFGRNLY